MKQFQKLWSAAQLLQKLQDDLMAGRGSRQEQHHYDRLLNEGLDPVAAADQVHRLRLALAQCHASGVDLDAALVDRAFHLLPMADHQPLLHLLVEAGHVEPKI